MVFKKETWRTDLCAGISCTDVTLGREQGSGNRPLYRALKFVELKFNKMLDK